MAHWNVCRFLEKNHSKRGKRTGNVVVSTSHEVLLHQCLKEFFNNRALPATEQRREARLDKSHIHEHCNWNDDSLWDPNDEEDPQHGKSKNKEHCHCFFAAIQGASVDGLEPAGLVQNSVWRFCLQKKGDSEGDCHKVFNGQNFVGW